MFFLNFQEPVLFLHIFLLLYENEIFKDLIGYLIMIMEETLYNMKLEMQWFDVMLYKNEIFKLNCIKTIRVFIESALGYSQVWFKLKYIFCFKLIQMKFDYQLESIIMVVSEMKSMTEETKIKCH